MTHTEITFPDKMTYGEASKRVAEILGCRPDDLDNYVVTGIGKDGVLRTMSVDPHPECIARLLHHAAEHIIEVDEGSACDEGDTGGEGEELLIDPDSFIVGF